MFCTTGARVSPMTVQNAKVYYRFMGEICARLQKKNTSQATNNSRAKFARRIGSLELLAISFAVLPAPVFLRKAAANSTHRSGEGK